LSHVKDEPWFRGSREGRKKGGREGTMENGRDGVEGT